MGFSKTPLGVQYSVGVKRNAHLDLDEDNQFRALLVYELPVTTSDSSGTVKVNGGVYSGDDPEIWKSSSELTLSSSAYTGAVQSVSGRIYLPMLTHVKKFSHQKLLLLCYGFVRKFIPHQISRLSNKLESIK